MVGSLEGAGVGDPPGAEHWYMSRICFTSFSESAEREPTTLLKTGLTVSKAKVPRPRPGLPLP